MVRRSLALELCLKLKRETRLGRIHKLRNKISAQQNDFQEESTGKIQTSF